MMEASINATNSTLDIAGPVKLFDTQISGGGTVQNQNRQYDVGRDGRFLINSFIYDAAAPITILQNWKPPAQ